MRQNKMTDVTLMPPAQPLTGDPPPFSLSTFLEDIGLHLLIKHNKQFDSMGPVGQLAQKYFPHFIQLEFSSYSGCHIHSIQQQLNCQQQ